MLNQFLHDELVNKLYFLHKELADTKKDLNFLEEENRFLKDALANLASINKEDYAISFENSGESTIAA